MMKPEITAVAESSADKNPLLVPSDRSEVTDQRLNADLTAAKLANGLFVRFIAKGKRFSSVDFKYSIFDTCYFRNCVFDSCDFTGCRFIGTNLVGSSFVGCKFDYAIFERTLIDSDILNSGCPGHENLKLKFARTLRMNFQQVGDAQSANKAIKIELEATETHLRKAWKSNESYYRKKYVGLERVKAFFSWVEFRALDFIWGNGESALKLARAVLLVFLVMCFIDVISFKDAQRLTSYIHSFLEMPQIFLGTLSPGYYPSGYLAVILFVRLVALAFLLSIIIKRFNRR